MKNQITTMVKNTLVSLVLISTCILSSCNDVPQVGIIKNVNSGITTTYTNIKPEEVFIYMNGERCEHNQIPLGESFEVINNKINSLTEKDGNVSIGCSLKITDKKGTVLMNETDLFASNSVYPIDSITFLRCTVSTGSPMKYEEKYDVEIKYWDKYGNGTLENKLEVEMIDLP